MDKVTFEIVSRVISAWLGCCVDVCSACVFGGWLCGSASWEDEFNGYCQPLAIRFTYEH